jgi:hypothetical protein
MIASLFHNEVIDYCRDRINPSRHSLPTFTTTTTTTTTTQQTAAASPTSPAKQSIKQKKSTQHSLRQRRRHSNLSTVNEFKKFAKSNNKSNDNIDYDCWGSDSDSSSDDSGTTASDATISPKPLVTKSVTTKPATTKPSTASTADNDNDDKCKFIKNKVLVVYNIVMVYMIMFIIIGGTALIATERGIESMMPDYILHHKNFNDNTVSTDAVTMIPRQQLAVTKQTLLEKLKLLEDVPEDEELDEEEEIGFVLSSQSKSLKQYLQDDKLKRSAKNKLLQQQQQQVLLDNIQVVQAEEPEVQPSTPSPMLLRKTTQE